MKMKWLIVWVALAACARAAPVPGESTGQADIGSSGKSDLPVQELEKLKAEADPAHAPPATAGTKEHVEYHSLDVLKSNGATVSQLERHASADAGPGSEHTSLRLDVPAAGVHRLVVDGQEVTTPATEDHTPKIFHGAARLITGSGMPQLPGPPSAVRRSLKPDIMRSNTDRYTSLNGGKYSPVEMAEYVFWTGDEKGVTTAIEESLQEGLMTKEEAIAFLQEIKFYIEYLRVHYAQNLRNEEAQRDKMRNIMMEQANARQEAYRLHAGLPYARGWELGNGIGQTFGDRQEVKRTYPDPVLQTNVINTSDYESDGSVVSEEEYEEMMERLKIADSLYTEYTLEEIIYQLAKMMFSQSLSRDPKEARASIQRFMAFLEAQAQRGQLPRAIEKRVLDVMVAALTDTIGDHVEQLQARDLGAGDRLMHHFFETAMEQPSMSRTLLAAYKDEILKQPYHKMAFPERN